MSGFFGIVRQDGAASDGLVETIAAGLRFRGPDAANIWSHAEFSTCFILMQTDAARQAAAQPVTLDQRYWLIGDIRLDARLELIDQIKQAGEHPAPTATDEALLLYAWRCWGEASLQRLIGDYSFALWDALEKRLHCVRDFIGARPFFYAQFPGGFCFSNTLRSLLSVPHISRQLDDRFVGDFLLAGVSLDHTRSVYHHIRRLLSGYLLTYSNATVETRRFLTLPIEDPAHFSSPQSCVEAFRALLVQAVTDRLPPGPVAFYLSGGLDSAAVAATACTLTCQPQQRASLKAFTESWQPLLPDREPHFAALTARHLGLAHEIFEHGNSPPLPSGVAPHLLSSELATPSFPEALQRELRAVASHSRVVLSGDGGDDVLNGQSWPYLTHLWRQGDWGVLARTYLGYFFSHGRLPPLRGGFRKKIANLLRKEDPWAGYPHWLDPGFEARAELRRRWQELECSPEYLHPVHPLAYAALHSHFWSSILEPEDTGFTGELCETRTPLLDIRLLRFLLRLSPVPWCVNKLLLREAFRSDLPPAVLRRSKAPLAEDPLQVALRSYLVQPLLLADPPAQLNQFVNWDDWLTTFANVKGSLNGASLRPLSLFLWLKAIENT